MASTLTVSEANVNTIANLSGTTAATIDSAGRILQPAKPSFLVTPGSTVSLTEGNGHMILPFDNAIFDIGGNYNTSNNHYVCPIAGVYFFALNVRFDSVASGGYLRGLIYKGTDAATVTGPWNNASGSLASITDGQGTSYHSMTCSGYMQCNAGDIITPMGGHNVDASISVQSQSQFSGALIG
jgi:hypothetical protein